MYTARPEIPAPLVRGRQYRITAAFKRKIASSETFTGYEDLYQRATTLANARITELQRAERFDSLHQWILFQGWRSMGDAYRIACAFVTMGLVCPEPRAAKPEGEPAPASAELMIPGGATLEMLSTHAPQQVDEIYNEFDLRDPGAGAGLVTFSYGERAPAVRELDFEPFVRRAGNRARLYWESLSSRPAGDGFRALRREWWSTTGPDLAVVMVYFRV